MLFLIQFDGETSYVEAPDMCETIHRWKEAMELTWGDIEEPESCAAIHDGEVIR